MATDLKTSLDIPSELLEAIRALPPERVIVHCGEEVRVSPFALYTECPHCGERLKVRAFSAHPELEDVFDAVFEWMNDPRARAVAERRRAEIEAD